MSGQCIWCREVTNDHDVEHIIPESIGCPPQFVLPGTVVCRRCNNSLAHLDRVVAHEFDLDAFMAGVPRKGGKPPVVSSRGNLRGTYFEGSPTFTFNMNRHHVRAHDGSQLAPFRGAPRDFEAKVSSLGHLSKISASVQFGQSPKFVRGLTKIALSSVAYFLGAEVALAEILDAARSYVVRGVGTRHALLQPSSDSEYRNTVWAPYRDEQGQLAVTFRLAQMEFILDLSPDETLLPKIAEKQLEQMGTNGWCVLPPYSK